MGTNSSGFVVDDAYFLKNDYFFTKLTKNESNQNTSSPLYLGIT